MLDDCLGAAVARNVCLTVCGEELALVALDTRQGRNDRQRRVR